MKKYLVTLFILLPLCASAQGNWTVPTKTAEAEKTVEKKAENKVSQTTEVVVDGKTYKVKTEDMPYLQGAVPVVDGRVSYRIEIPMEGLSAKEVYDIAYKKLEDLVSETSELKRSRIAIVNEDEHIIVASIEEWLTFADKILVLDRSRFNYVVQAECKDGLLKFTIERLYYDYDSNRAKEHYPAEGFITDDVMLTNNGTKMRKVNSKFRRATVDRMNGLMKELSK